MISSRNPLQGREKSAVGWGRLRRPRPFVPTLAGDLSPLHFSSEERNRHKRPEGDRKGPHPSPASTMTTKRLPKGVHSRGGGGRGVGWGPLRSPSNHKCVGERGDEPGYSSQGRNCLNSGSDCSTASLPAATNLRPSENWRSEMRCNLGRMTISASRILCIPMVAMARS